MEIAWTGSWNSLSSRWPIRNRAKAFYTEEAGFDLVVDHRAGDFRVVQVTPPGSACSVALMKNAEAAGSVQGLHLVVSDIDAARSALSIGGLRSASCSLPRRCSGLWTGSATQRLWHVLLLQRP